MNRKEIVEHLYSGYLQNIVNTPFKIDFIKIREMANELFFTGLGVDTKFQDEFLNDERMTNEILARELTTIGTYWLYVVVEDSPRAKYRVVDGGHRSAALKLLTLAEPQLLDYEICAVIITKDLVNDYVGPDKEYKNFRWAAQHLKKGEKTMLSKEEYTLTYPNPLKYPYFAERFPGGTKELIRKSKDYTEDCDFYTVNTRVLSDYIKSLGYYSISLRKLIYDHNKENPNDPYMPNEYINNKQELYALKEGGGIEWQSQD